jgi:hypothetical protein
MADTTKIDRFIQSSPHLAWLATTGGHCVYANPVLERLTGSIQIRSTKLTGAVSFWKRTEPSPQLLGKGPPQPELRIVCRSACEGAMAPLNASNSSLLCSRSMYRSRKGMNHRREGVRRKRFSSERQAWSLPIRISAINGTRLLCGTD